MSIHAAPSHSSERTRRIKVCHVLFSLDIGGIETLAVKLVNRLDRTRFEHVILCLRPGNELEPQLEPGAARVVYLDKKDGQDLGLYLELVRFFRRERPDVVHTRNWSTLLEGLVPALAAGVPGRVHSFDGLNADNLGPEPRRRIWTQRLLFRSVPRLLARSPAMQTSMAEQLSLPPARIELVADGIELERFDGEVDVAAVRARFGIPSSALVVGIVARLDPVKDHAALLRAFARLAPQHPDLWVMIVGGGPIEAELKAQASQLEHGSRVVFTGPQLDVPALYRAMDIYAQPSLYEGVSGSLLEAMAARLPVVSTRVGGTVDIVQEDGNGALIEAGDDAALAGVLERLARDPALRRRWGHAGRQFVEEHYSLNRVLEQYAEVYSHCSRAGR